MRQLFRIVVAMVGLVLIVACYELVVNDEHGWPASCEAELINAGNLARWSQDMCSRFKDRQSLYQYLSTLAAKEGRPDEYYLSKQKGE